MADYIQHLVPSLSGQPNYIRAESPQPILDTLAEVDEQENAHYYDTPSQDDVQQPVVTLAKPSEFETSEPKSGRDPTHLREEAIEENGDERVPHFEYYEGADEFPVNPPPEQTAALILAPATKYHTMAVLPGRCVRGFIDSFSLIISIALIIIQFGLIDLFYVKVTGESIWAAWIGVDSVVVVLLVVLGVLAIRYNGTQMEEVCSVDAKLKYAYIVWGIYSVVLASKVAAVFRLFYQEIPPNPLDNNDKLFDDTLFKHALSLSVLIFIFIFETHHYTPLTSHRQLYVACLIFAITLDLIDNILFLDLLWQASKDGWNLDFWIELVILVIVCVNFFMPTFALAKLRFGRFPRCLLVSEKIYSLLYVLVVNGPILGLRIYLYIFVEIQQKGRRYDPSVFAIKNIAVLYIAIRELWTRLQYWRMKRRAIGSRGELTAHHEDK